MGWSTVQLAKSRSRLHTAGTQVGSDNIWTARHWGRWVFKANGGGECAFSGFGCPLPVSCNLVKAVGGERCWPG